MSESGQTTHSNTSQKLMPVLFVGHGNPMYAITDNPYRTSWAELGLTLPRPEAILCISAHWLTNGTSVTLSEQPKTIHDFGGFPDELFQQEYPAPGAVLTAKSVIQNVTSVQIDEDYKWGLDHGAWAVLMNMYPMADIPVFQMSLDYLKSPRYHFNLARELSFLRKNGVMVIASGNIVHNLRQMRWEDGAKPFTWAIEFDSFVKKHIEDNKPEHLIEIETLGARARLANPTNDHYLPLMYALGLREESDELQFFNETIDMGSMSMRSLVFSS